MSKKSVADMRHKMQADLMCAARCMAGAPGTTADQRLELANHAAKHIASANKIMTTLLVELNNRVKAAEPTPADTENMFAGLEALLAEIKEPGHDDDE